MKTYLTTIFILFIHVVILLLAASLFTGMSAVSGNDTPNTLIAIVAGLATIIALLKTQGVMMQFSYVSLGPRSMRQLGSQFMNGVSYLGGKGRSVAASVSSAAGSRATSGAASKVRASAGVSAKRGGGTVSSSYQQPRSSPSVTVVRKPATGQISKAPLVNERKLPDGRIDTGASSIRKEDLKRCCIC